MEKEDLIFNPILMPEIPGIVLARGPLETG